MTDFYVGQRVVCVKRGHWMDTKTEDVDRTPGQPKYGDVLTIRKILEDEWLVFTKPLIGHRVYHRCRFKPVQEKKTDISIFTAMLNEVEA
jgi:hypothetical protein